MRYNDFSDIFLMAIAIIIDIALILASISYNKSYMEDCKMVGKEVLICGDTLMVVRMTRNGDFILSNDLKVERDIIKDNLID